MCRESASTVKVFKNFKESGVIKPGFSAEAMSGGALLSIRSSEFICFYDWNTLKVGTFNVPENCALFVPRNYKAFHCHKLDISFLGMAPLAKAVHLIAPFQ